MSKLKNSKPPSKHTRQLGAAYCKGVCVRYKSPKPNWGNDPYETHSYCRKCGGVWMKKESCVIGKNNALRCPCCNWLTSNKSRKSKSIGSKKKVYYEL